MKEKVIDFGNERVSVLFKKLFFPTLLGMLSMSAVTTIDGIFVGHGVGSDGIAAVNICVPLLMSLMGVGLMMGAGCSVIASIYLSKGKTVLARATITQAMLFVTLISVTVGGFILAFPEETARMLGSSEHLLPLVVDYLVWFSPSLLFELWIAVALFAMRLDGAPKLAMWCSIIAAAVNVTRLHSLRPGRKRILFFFHDIGMQCKIGSSALLGELTMAILLFIGNQVFMRHLGDDGVGAFGVSCYYLPFVFMIGNAIAQSAQPIISYNFGTGSTERVRSALRVSVFAALVCGVISTAAFILFPELLVGLFLRIDNTAARIAIEGFPYYGTGFIFFILNLSIIGYYQSMERIKPAITFAVLRGFVFLVPCFMVLPAIMGVKGIWLALPLSEILTTLVIVVTFWIYSRQRAIICRQFFRI